MLLICGQSYDAKFLRIYPQLPSTPLQLEEDLEQLKVLENGYKMKVSDNYSQSYIHLYCSIMKGRDPSAFLMPYEVFLCFNMSCCEICIVFSYSQNHPMNQIHCFYHTCWSSGSYHSCWRSFYLRLLWKIVKLLATPSIFENYLSTPSNLILTTSDVLILVILNFILYLPSQDKFWCFKLR